MRTLVIYCHFHLMLPSPCAGRGATRIRRDQRCANGKAAFTSGCAAIKFIVTCALVFFRADGEQVCTLLHNSFAEGGRRICRVTVDATRPVAPGPSRCRRTLLVLDTVQPTSSHHLIRLDSTIQQQRYSFKSNRGISSSHKPIVLTFRTIPSPTNGVWADMLITRWARKIRRPAPNYRFS